MRWFLAALCLPLAAVGQEFDRIVIDDNFPGAYQVEVADVNGDKKADIIALGGGTCAWYENPTWKKRVITGPDRTPGIITSATADLDGDGKAEVAIGYEFEMNQPKKGKLGLAVQEDDESWTFRHIADVGSIHRIRWMRSQGAALPRSLVVAPIFGPSAQLPDYSDPAKLLAFVLPERDPISGKWEPSEWARRPVIHAIEVSRFLGNEVDVVLTADNLGIGLVLPHFGGRDGTLDLVPGAKGDSPNRGSSEIHYGRLGRDRHFFATIEPWHGDEVVIWRWDRNPAADPPGPAAEYTRAVLDNTLDAGHALWVADIDGDKDDEIFAGHRGKDHRVSMYKFEPKSKTWNRTVIDREIAAQDLRGGDLDGDGTPDVVAVGGSTHNVVWYRARRGRP
jgi:hypothetical protein